MSDEVPKGDSPDLEGIDPLMHEVVRRYGRPMFALVMNAGMSGQAAEVLSLLVSKHQSRHGAHALGVLVEAFNQLSDAYAKSAGWDAGQLAQCERDIQLAWSGRLVVAGAQALDA